MRISGTGNVGIGTDNPLSKLDLNGGASGDVVLRLEADTDNAGSEADNPRIEMYQDNKLIYAHIGFNEDTPTPANIFQMAVGSPDGFVPYALTINPYGGNIGIGTVNATEKLSVNGTIRSKEVKVEATPWPDYVFAEDYSLKTLEETEAFIKENNRLPDMPSAKEVAENGIALGEMNRLLVEKVEELTLYLIELKKENEQVKTELSQQQMANSQSQLSEKVEELTLYLIELKKENEQVKIEINQQLMANDQSQLNEKVEDLILDLVKAQKENKTMLDRLAKLESRLSVD